MRLWAQGEGSEETGVPRWVQIGVCTAVYAYFSIQVNHVSLKGTALYLTLYPQVMHSLKLLEVLKK